MFGKVERLFLLGLRAPDPCRRARFFELYNKLIPPGLFERLQFIICHQVRAPAAACCAVLSAWLQRVVLLVRLCMLC